jgi:hypothetical protein
MTAADVTQKCEGALAYDFKVITHSDGETYVTKLSKPYGAIITPAEAPANGTGLSIYYTLSGRTFTIVQKDGGVAASDKQLSIMVYGRK